MKAIRLINTVAGLGMAISIGPASTAAAPYQQQPTVTFKSGIDLVQVSAVVRDKKGRLVQNLEARDFEVLDGGVSRPISDFRQDQSNVTVALLFDVSGSMEAQQRTSREAANHLLSWLKDVRDEAAIFTFDTRLDEIAPFTTGLKELPARLNNVTPFGATSLHDAIAQAAKQLAGREARRRAVVVFTDGLDTASRLSASEVSGIASSIDVPVYVFAVVPSIDNPAAETSVSSAERSVLAGSISDLARWTGGHLFVASSPAERSISARRIIDELRHQYLIAFESGGQPGWRPLEIRARGKDLTVRARSGYFAGQSRLVSH
jgi:VWFA-related protein